MTTITLKGREIPLLYTTQEMLTIQQQIAPISETLKLILGRNPENLDDETDSSCFAGAKHLSALGKMVAILGNAALEEDGKEPELTAKKILRLMRPTDIGEVMGACVRELGLGMASEIPEKEETGPVDVTLEEMKKKEMKDG